MMGGLVVFDILGSEVAWLKVAFYASIESCEMEWKRLNGKVSKEKVPGVDNVPHTDSLELLLQRNAGLNEETIVGDRLVVSA